MGPLGSDTCHCPLPAMGSPDFKVHEYRRHSICNSYSTNGFPAKPLKGEGFHVFVLSDGWVVWADGQTLWKQWSFAKRMLLKIAMKRQKTRQDSHIALDFTRGKWFDCTGIAL